MPFGLLLPLRIAQFVFSIVVLGLSAYGMGNHVNTRSDFADGFYSCSLVRCRHIDNLAFSDQLLGFRTSILIPFNDLP